MAGRKQGVKNTQESRLRNGAERRLCERCGAEIWVARWQRERDPSAGRYCSRACKWAAMRGVPTTIKQRGPERIIRSDGYALLWRPDHPRAHDGRVLEHIVVMERVLGRSLAADEQVHHLNHDRADNRPENLIVLTADEHTRHHARDPKWRERLAAHARARPQQRDVVTGRFTKGL